MIIQISTNQKTRISHINPDFCLTQTKWGISVKDLTYIFSTHWQIIWTCLKSFKGKDFSQTDLRYSPWQPFFFCHIKKDEMGIFFLVEDLTNIIHAEFGSNWPSSFRSRRDDQNVKSRRQQTKWHKLMTKDHTALWIR